MPKKKKIRIHGNDRGLMMICRAIRLNWLRYGENRKEALDAAYNTVTEMWHCAVCGEGRTSRNQLDADHKIPVGPRPRVFAGLGDYAFRMFNIACQALCKSCHKSKTDAERQRRKAE